VNRGNDDGARIGSETNVTDQGFIEYRMNEFRVVRSALRKTIYLGS